MHPIVSQCYGVANERAADPLAAYLEIHRGALVEQLLDQALANPQQCYTLSAALEKSAIDSSDDYQDRTLSISDAIRQFFDTFDWEALPESDQLKILDRCGRYFPKVNVLSTRSLAWKESRLRGSAHRALPGCGGYSFTPGNTGEHGG